MPSQGQSGEADTPGSAVRRWTDRSKAAARPALSVATLLDRDAGHVFEERLHSSIHLGMRRQDASRGADSHFRMWAEGPLDSMRRTFADTGVSASRIKFEVLPGYDSVDAAMSLSRR